MDEKHRKMNDNKVLEAELKSLKPGARVFKQQQNSNVYFLASRDKVFEECKKTLDDLAKEYSKCDQPTPPTNVEQ